MPRGPDPDARPVLQFVELVIEFDRAGVRWIMTGSAVLVAFGADFVPNDLDVTPDLDADNLERLAGVLERLRAIPADLAGWDDGLTDEQRRTWRPDPPTEQHLDHLFVTDRGMLDVVPRLCGTYDELVERSMTAFMGEVAVRVCHPSDVLRLLDGRARPKDLVRRAQYESLAARLTTGDPTPDLTRLT